MPEPTAENWRAAVADLRALNEEVRRAVRGFDPARLDARPTAPSRSFQPRRRERRHDPRRPQPGTHEKALADFMAGKVPVLVATDVAAGGSTSTASTWSSTTTPPTTTRRTCTARVAPASRESGVAVTLMLWNQENTIRVVQRRLGLQLPIVEVFSNDPRPSPT